jgi:hypothetical protein
MVKLVGRREEEERCDENNYPFFEFMKRELNEVKTSTVVS